MTLNVRTYDDEALANAGHDAMLLLEREIAMRTGNDTEAADLPVRISAGSALSFLLLRFVRDLPGVETVTAAGANGIERIG